MYKFYESEVYSYKLHTKFHHFLWENAMNIKVNTSPLQLIILLLNIHFTISKYSHEYLLLLVLND